MYLVFRPKGDDLDLQGREIWVVRTPHQTLTRTPLAFRLTHHRYPVDLKAARRCGGPISLQDEVGIDLGWQQLEPQGSKPENFGFGIIFGHLCMKGFAPH